MSYVKLKAIIFTFLSTLSLFTGTLLFASSCEQEVKQTVEAFRSNVSSTVIDINGDGRDEILYYEICSGTGCLPEWYIVYYTDTCQFKKEYLSRWERVGFGPIDFYSDKQFAYMSGADDITSAGLDKVYITYKFDGKSVKYASTKKAALLKSILEITSTEIAHKGEGVKTTKDFDLNGDGKLESISCWYWKRWRVLTGCRIINQSGDNSLLSEERRNIKRFGVLPKKYNNWHVLVEDYADMLLYKTDVGYIELDSLFKVSNEFDFFGDDLTEMGHKGITSQECQLICLENEECAAYSYIKSKKWCFPKHGKGNVQADLDVISGVKIGFVNGSNETYPDCLTDRQHFETNNPSDLDIKFCRSDLAKLSGYELNELADKNDSVQGTDENFGIQYNVINELEDWILVNLKENETEYNFHEIVGFNCNTQNFEELETNSITGSGEWTPSFSQYALVLNAVCGFEGNFVDTLKSFSNYCYLTYNVPWCKLDVSSAEFLLALIIGKKIQKENPQLSVWGIEFFANFNTTGCVECGSNMPEVMANSSTLSSDLFQFMEEQYNILFKSNPTVTIDDLRNVNQSDYENLYRVIDRF